MNSHSVPREVPWRGVVNRGVLQMLKYLLSLHNASFLLEINCGWPKPFYNGYLIGQDTTVGAIIFFRLVLIEYIKLFPSCVRYL